MNLRRLPFLLSLFAFVACGGVVKDGTSSGGGEGSSSDSNGDRVGGSNGSTSPGGSGSASAGPAIVAGANSILLSKGVLGEYAPGGGCELSAEKITYDLTSHDFTVVQCEAPETDAGPETPNTMVTREQRTLTATEIDNVQSLLAGYAQTAPPPKSKCGYDGTAYEIDVTTSNETTRYWDEAYNCSYPSDVKFVAPWLGTLFDELDAL